MIRQTRILRCQVLSVTSLVLATMLILFLAGSASAGPVIIGGDDADDHGSASGGVNFTGWLYIQKGFENLLPVVTNSNNLALCLGCGSGQGQGGFASGFDLATKPAGWTRATIDGDLNIASYFAGTHPSGRTLANTGLLYFPTDASNVSGGLDQLELAVLNTNATQINLFGAGGGGIFAHDETNTTGGWGWLTTLIPGITIHSCDSVPQAGCDTGNLTITPAGTAAFPGLTEADVDNATPWHAFFGGNLGGLSVLVTGPGDPTGGVNFTEQPVILGGGTGTVIGCGQPGQPPCPTVPEPSTIALLSAGLIGFGVTAWRRRARQ